MKIDFFFLVHATKKSLCVSKGEDKSLMAKKLGFLTQLKRGLIKWTEMIINSSLPFSAGPCLVPSCQVPQQGSHWIGKCIAFPLPWLPAETCKCLLWTLPLLHLLFAWVVVPGRGYLGGPLLDWGAFGRINYGESCGSFQRLKGQTTQKHPVCSVICLPLINKQANKCQLTYWEEKGNAQNSYTSTFFVVLGDKSAITLLILYSFL